MFGRQSGVGPVSKPSMQRSSVGEPRRGVQGFKRRALGRATALEAPQLTIFGEEAGEARHASTNAAVEMLYLSASSPNQRVTSAASHPLDFTESGMTGGQSLCLHKCGSGELEARCTRSSPLGIL